MVLVRERTGTARVATWGIEERTKERISSSMYPCAARRRRTAEEDDDREGNKAGNHEFVGRIELGAH